MVCRSPDAYNLPLEYTKLVAECSRQVHQESHNSDVWICKPVGQSQGRGISIFKVQRQTLNYSSLLVRLTLNIGQARNCLITPTPYLISYKFTLHFCLPSSSSYITAKCSHGPIPYPSFLLVRVFILLYRPLTLLFLIYYLSVGVYMPIQYQLYISILSHIFQIWTLQQV